MRKKVTPIALSAAMLLGALPYNVFAGETNPLVGDAARGSNQPAPYGYRAIDIENWSPQTDPYADLLRARIPLQNRNEAFSATQANPNLSSKTQLYNLTSDYNNYFFGAEPYTNEFSRYVYNFWQYTDYYGGWHGTTTPDVPLELFDPSAHWTMRAFEFGVLNLPNAAYTDAAHKNGVMSVGCLFLPRNGQPYDELLKRDENGEFPVAKKLIEIKEYYGFDGYFINQETSIDPKYIKEYKEFTKVLVDAGVHTQWYDTIDDKNGKLSYQAALIPSHSSYVKDDELGLVNNSIFMNYNWNSKDGWNNGDSTNQTYIKRTVAEAERKGIDPHETVFVGVEAAQGQFHGGHNSTRNMDVILDTETGQPLTSIAMFTPDFVQNALDQNLGDAELNRRGEDDYQWMIAERERMMYTSVKIDATDTEEQKGYSRSDVGVKDASEWTGVSRYIAERSVINGTTFVTNFNTGHGMEYCIDGKVASTQEWSNIGIQDILPTWQWWVESEGNKLQPDFDYGGKVAKGDRFTYKQVGAYKGGSSLVVNGTLDAENFLRLYKTDLQVEADSTAEVTFYKVSPTDDSTMKLGLIFEDAPEVVEYVAIPNTGKQTKDFITETVSLGEFADREIAAMGLVFTPGEVPTENYQMNIGEIKITDGKNYTPAKPTSFMVKNAFNTNEMYISWDLADYDTVKQYNVYAELSNGEEEYLGGAYDDIFYIKKMNPEVRKLKVRAVGADGSESEAAEVNFSYVDQITEVDVVETAEGLELSWKNPPTGFEKIQLELSFTDGRQDVYTKEVNKFSTATTFKVPVKDDDRYLLKISTVDASGQVMETTSCAGKMKDVYSQPYEGKYFIKGGRLGVDNPTATDWWHMYVYINGELKKPSKAYDGKVCDYRIRGFHALDDIASEDTLKDGDEIKIILEDYKGNLSEPTIYTYGESKELKIKELEPAQVETRVGVAPVLPDKVMATFVPVDEEVTTGSAIRVTPSYKKEEVDVAWEAVPETAYAQVGTFEVKGKVEGTALEAICKVDVVEKLALTLNGKDTVKPGETFEITIGASEINENAPIYAGDVLVEYNTELFELEGIKGAGTTEVAGSKEIAPGQVRVLTGTEGGSINEAEWITLTFTAKETEATQKGSIQVDESIFASVVDGVSGVIKGDLGKKDITVSVKPDITIDPEDVNQDGKVDVADLALVAYYYQANSASDNWQQAKVTDVNKDGRIDIKDLAAVANMILK